MIECKAKNIQHESKYRKQYKDYAVDGVLLYASYLKDGFNTTAIAVSGNNDENKKISSFLWLKEHCTFKNIQDTIFLNPSEISNIIQKQSKPFDEEALIKKQLNITNCFIITQYQKLKDVH